MGTGVIAKIMEKRGYDKSARVTRAVARTFGAISISLTEQALQGYTEQRIGLTES